MKEYNWREERKKYRPDFRNEQEIKEAPPQTPPPQTPGRNRNRVIFAAIFVVIAIIGIFLIVNGSRNSESTRELKVSWKEKHPVPHPSAPTPETAPPAPYPGISVNIGGDSATALAKIAERHKRSVGLVGLCVEFQDGTKVFIPGGTAWAFAPNKFATNSHVAMFLRKITRKYLAESKKPIRGFEVQIVINGTNRQIRPVTYVQIHRDYQLGGSQRDPDVAILTTGSRHDSYFKIAPQTVLRSMKSGDPVAFLGFPMERLYQQNIHIDNPIASMQTGIIVAVSDFDLKDSGPDKNVYIRHNLPSTGGASGSPIFNTRGEIIAILAGGNIIGQVVGVDQQNKPIFDRAPSAAQINEGIRVDLLQGVVDPVPVQEFIR